MNNTLDKKEPQWFAVYTRFKCEKLATELLSKKGIEVYLPLKTVIRIWGKQKRKKLLPLITSYVFVKIVQSEYINVLETEKVMSFIKFSGAPISIPEEEINILKRVVGDLELDITAQPVSLRMGDCVEIISGSLVGLNGVLKGLRGKQQVVVELEHIGYTLTITTKKNMVAPLSRH